MEPKYCQFCFTKDCKKTNEGAFNICSYRVVFLNREGEIEKRIPMLPITELSKNLRHEINPILQSIINSASLIDPNLSVRKIDVENPLSRIVGSTVIIDMVIQMITGINDFFDYESTLIQKTRNLKNIIDYYYSVYSIVKDGQKVQNLYIDNQIPDYVEVSTCSDLLNYMIATLIDNAWKHSIESSTVSIQCIMKSNNQIDLTFSNFSKRIPETIDIFQSGTKVNPESKGFGHGLFWLKTLIFYYNNIVYKTDALPECLSISHEQIDLDNNDRSEQNFILKNIIID